MLRNTIAGLEAEKMVLGDDIKDAMLQGQTPETDLYRARLQNTREVSYPVDSFRDLCGDAAMFEVATIDPKKVKTLIEAGDLDAKSLDGMCEIREQRALCLMAKERDS
jgi:hypothetical protein